MKSQTPKIESIALIGNYLPRTCGIATFTFDLRSALSAKLDNCDVWAIAMNDRPAGYDYPPEVRYEINQDSVADYQLAADYLNMNSVDLVCLQHEFGIFGGPSGIQIIRLLESLEMPIVVTLHSVLKRPDDDQRLVMRELDRITDSFVVMSQVAVDILEDVYKIDSNRIALISHGIPDIAFIDPAFYKEKYNVDGRRVLLTFGLISPGKGLEQMVDALPAIVSRDPSVVYLVLGVTHPNIIRDSGEEYRESILERARALGVSDHLIFHNRFVSIDELCEFLVCADVYITPYLNAEQVVSGTLAYAMGAGKAVVSTPYWYATEMLAEERGLLVPFDDPVALSDAVISLIADPTKMNRMRRKAYLHCRNMVWREVAIRYQRLFNTIVTDKTKKITAVPHQAVENDESNIKLPQINLDHLVRMTDDTGILQHAVFSIPDFENGYTTDDNARALVAVQLGIHNGNDDRRLKELTVRYLAFQRYAFNSQEGRFRNVLDFKRVWADIVGSEDCHGRSVWALGTTVALSRDEYVVGMAADLLERALPAFDGFSSPRAWSFGILGLCAYLERFSGDRSARAVLEHLSARLFGLIDDEDDEWPWIEERLTYANAKIPHALIAAGDVLERSEITRGGTRLLDWLINVQTDPQGYLVPIGNQGWYSRSGERARYDQQPVDAQSMVEACAAAYLCTGEKRWLDFASMCYQWFLGKNDLQAPIYDIVTGGCRDGLQSNRVNLNQGAESTLAWLISLLTMQRLLRNISV